MRAVRNTPLLAYQFLYNYLACMCHHLLKLNGWDFHIFNERLVTSLMKGKAFRGRGFEHHVQGCSFYHQARVDDKRDAFDIHRSSGLHFP